MGLLDRLGLVRRSNTPNLNFLTNWFGSIGEVAERRALGQPSVWSAVNLIVGDLSSLALKVYDRTPDGGRQSVGIDAKAWLPWMLRFQPNPYQTAPVFLGVVSYDLLLKGGAFIFKAANQVGEVVQLHRIPPEQVEVKWDGRRKWYVFDGTTFSDTEIIHVLGLTTDGYRGVSLLQVCNKALSGAVALDEFSGDYFKNSAVPSGLLTTEDKTGAEGRKQAQADWEARYSGAGNRHKIAVLAGAWKYQPISSNAKDAQLLEAKAFTVSEVARLFRIPGYKLGDMSKTSYSSNEQQNLDYWQSCLRPLAVRIEAAFNAGLVSAGMQAVRFVEFDYTSIVKPDSSGMTDLLDKQVKAGLITLNEARAKLNYNRVEGGDFLLIPQNQAKLEGGKVEPINQITAPGGSA